MILKIRLHGPTQTIQELRPMLDAALNFTLENQGNTLELLMFEEDAREFWPEIAVNDFEPLPWDGIMRQQSIKAVPTWVLADDDHYYKNPDIAGQFFFIVWDDVEPVEVVVKSVVCVGGPEIFISDLMKFVGLEFSCISEIKSERRVFVDSLEMQDAFSVYVKVKYPIPAKSISTHSGRVSAGSKLVEMGDCVIYE